MCKIGANYQQKERELNSGVPMPTNSVLLQTMEFTEDVLTVKPVMVCL